MVPLKIADQANHVLPVDFSTFEQAELFASWLNTNYGKTKGTNKLTIGKQGKTLVFDVPPAGPFQAQKVFESEEIESQCKDMNL
jgi:hypothetical protein